MIRGERAFILLYPVGCAVQVATDLKPGVLDRTLKTDALAFNQASSRFLLRESLSR